MVIIKSRRVGTYRDEYDDEGAVDRRSVQRGGWCRVEAVWGVEAVDGGARTEYFNFLRGCATAVQSRSRRERFTRTVWLACLPGVDRGRNQGVSLDGRTPDFHPLSGSEATPSAPTSPPPPPPPPPPPSLHHHSDCEQTDCEYSVVARGSFADDALGQINFRHRLARRIKNKGSRTHITHILQCSQLTLHVYCLDICRFM